MRLRPLAGALALLLAAGLAGSDVLVADGAMSRMIELTAKVPYCAVHGDRGVIRRMVLSADPVRVRLMTDASVAALAAACANGSLAVPEPGGFLYPGTEWCGPGESRGSAPREPGTLPGGALDGRLSTVAGDGPPSRGALGAHAAEDRCCREHGRCPASLAPGECRRGVCNRSRYVRSHCDCDARFRRCLQALNTETANALGAIYFNVVQVTCFKERRPCSRWQRNGLSEEESKAICSQWKFRPSDYYVPLMPPPSQYR